MIIAIGDIHGNISEMTNKIKECGTNVNFVQIGDFGLGFHGPTEYFDKLQYLHWELEGTESKLYVIRGNHDNPAFWVPGNGYDFKNIHFVRDNTVIKIDDKICYFAGGAISIDRTSRIQGVSYWKNESYNFFPPTYPSEDVSLELIDIVFAHDVYHPISKFDMNSPFVKEWARRDSKLMNDLIESQNQMGELFDYIKGSCGNKLIWVHGHYHQSHVNYMNFELTGDFISDTPSDITTYSLGIDEFKEIR